MKIFVFSVLLFLALPIGTRAQHDAMIISTPSIPFDSAVSLTISEMLADDPADSTEGGYLRGFTRWSDFYRNRVAKDAPANENMLKPAGDALFYFLNNMEQYCSNDPGVFTGNWSCLGPFNDYYGLTERQGRIDALWVDPNDIGYILAGSNMGGLWRSTDTGHTWHNITDPTPTNNSIIPGTMGATRIAVNPLDRDTIYIALNMMETLRKSGGYAMGVMYTHDGGQTWNVDNNFLSANQQTNIAYFPKWVRKMIYMPGTGNLFAISNDRLLQKPAGSSSWHNVTPPGVYGSGVVFTDLEFARQNTGLLVASTDAKDSASRLWVVDVNDPSPAWKELVIKLPAPYYQKDDGIDKDMIVDFSISGNDIAYLNLAARLANGNKRMMLVTTPLDTADVDMVNTDFYDIQVNPLTQDTNRTEFQVIEVSEANPDILYLTVHDGSKSFFTSIDGGMTFTNSGIYCHADGRTLFVYHTDAGATGQNDIVFGGSDGGVVMKRSGDTVYRSITGSGLAVTQFYGLSNTEANEHLVTGGAQDNGAYAYMGKRATPWQAYVYGGDNYMTKFANKGVLQSYTEGNPFSSMANIKFNTTNNTTTVKTVGRPADFGNVDCQYCSQNNLQRPLYFEPDSNKAFVGYFDIWTQPLDSTVWTPAFESFPVARWKARTFAISEPNKDTVYIAYEDPANGNPSPPSDSIGKLFLSTDANSKPPNAPPTWTNKTPPHVQWGGITSLATAPNNLSRVWISLGNVGYDAFHDPDLVSHKVLYSGDYGDTWTDVSKGLPPVPVNKILYQEGTDDVLFAGTDAGVFRWNKADSTWYCFNTGLPPVVVNDMEFNYCAGKLRIATFGRGIWETAIFADSALLPQQNNIITSNTIWSATQYLKSGVRIKNGATLTIQNTAPNQTTIFMPRNGNIIVEPGAKLVVNGARITNGCEDCMWDGIRVVGVYNQPQTIAYQGVVELNGAIIEHAKVAVGNYDITGHPHFSTGGIIKAENTHFLNNATSISLEPYTDRTGSPFLQNYQAKFTTCTFEVDDDFKGGNDNKFTAHVNLRQVSGVSFLGADFLNNATNALKGEGDGIRTHSAGFTLKAWCDPFIFPCTYVRNGFSGLRTGVYMGLDISGRLTSCEIDRSNFDSCSVGIFSNGQHHFVATRDSFRMGYGKTTDLDAFDCDKNIGIWTQNAWSPVIEDNSFVGFIHGGQEPTHQNIGTVTDNSSEHNNRIYNNTFHDLHRASIARGRNSDGIVSARGSQNGLRYLCNTYDDNNYDIEVMDLGTVTTHQAHTIAYSQGSFVQSAGNQFPDRSSFFHIQDVSTWGGFKYYHTTGNTVPQMPANTNVWPFMSLSGNTCVSQYAPGGGGIGFPMSTSSLNDVKASYHDAASARLVLIGDLDGYIDGGNTVDLLNYVNTSTMADSPTVRTTLLGYSPYLSKEVLMATASAAILPQSVLMEILQANPDVLRDGELLEHLAGTPIPLTGPQIEELQTTAYNSTARTELLGDIADLSAEMGRASSIVLNHYLLDTVTTERDSIPVWLDHIHTPEAEYSKVAFYTSLGDYTTAASLISGITTKFSMGTEQEQERDLYQELWTLMKDVYEDGRTARELTEGEITQLEGIGDDPIATGRLIGTQVHVILDEPINQFRLPCSLPEPSSSEGKPGRRSNIAVNSNGSAGNIIKAYPNPASDFIIFEYDIPKASGRLSIVVTGITGQEAAVLEPEQPKGKSQLDTRSLPAGVYLYKLYDGSRQVGVGRIVIAK